MDLLGPVHTFDRYQQGRKRWAIPMAVIRKFGNDQAGSLAALIAYYAFFSIFPLLLVFTTILAFVLQGNRELYTDVRNSVLGQFPVVGNELQAHALTGKVTALVLGLLTSLWGGLGVTNAAQNAFDKVWAVPYKDRPNFFKARLRGLMLLICLGALFVLSAAAAGVVTAIGGPLVKIGVYAVTLLVNFGLYMAAFRFLTAVSIPTRCLWLGAGIAAVFLLILQLVGGIYVNHVIKHASNTYGTFATVIGLLVWLHLIAQLTLYSVEINVVVVRRLWPRSLLGPPEAPADQETLRALAKVEERHAHEQVDVHFRDPVQVDGDEA
ncbi:MAG TPA: YihY/virulence factor BrkB family protein [Solirubrobacteraceae bacterium]|nr:YihY/virulence factor BrkB family protein [Solirubrobacteraceae bacterium]